MAIKRKARRSGPRRRHPLPAPPPFAPFTAWEIATARQTTQTNIYDQMTAGEIPFVALGRLKGIPYEFGKKLLGNLTDEQISELRRHLAEQKRQRLVTAD